MPPMRRRKIEDCSQGVRAFVHAFCRLPGLVLVGCHIRHLRSAIPYTTFVRESYIRTSRVLFPQKANMIGSPLAGPRP